MHDLYMFAVWDLYDLHDLHLFRRVESVESVGSPIFPWVNIIYRVYQYLVNVRMRVPVP